MSRSKQNIKEELHRVIVNTCNKIGCTDCPLKWPKDEEGNSCQSDFLMMKLAEEDNETL